jgi:hypothetical protein
VSEAVGLTQHWILIIIPLHYGSDGMPVGRNENNSRKDGRLPNKDGRRPREDESLGRFPRLPDRCQPIKVDGKDGCPGRESGGQGFGGKSRRNRVLGGA